MKIGLLGFGTVGRGVVERIQMTNQQLTNTLSQQINIEAVLIKNHQKHQAEKQTLFVTNDWQEFSQKCDYDVVFEAIGGLEPAYEYTRFFLEKGIPVVSANKKLVAEKGSELEEIAESRNIFYSYEAAVAGGIPIINLLEGSLSTTPISKITGILNGTTNYILTEVKEKGVTVEEALSQAQLLGYAESDPKDDIEGYDAWYKIRILAKLCFGSWLNPNKVERKGLNDVQQWHIELGQKLGLTLKLVAEATYLGDGEAKAEVAPVFISNDNPFTYVNGVTNAILIEGPTIGQLCLQGPGAGKEATANSMVEDFLFQSNYEGKRSKSSGVQSEVANSFNHYFIFVANEDLKAGILEVEKGDNQICAQYSHPEGEVYVVKGQDISSAFPVIKIIGGWDPAQVKAETESAILFSL
ncbi:homoserine dehydrogenase [Bacillus sp. TS-2]|nr:homoserine dehydrogenase [Bacillus sp. TS-2]